MSAEPLRAVYLITGSDGPKITLALRRLRARFEPGSVEHLFAGSSSGEDAVAALNALGLFGDGERLVIVEGIARWTPADVEAVSHYAEAPNPGAVLALVGEPLKGSALESACEHAGQILRYDVPTRQRGRQRQPDFPAWVRTQFERFGVRADVDAAHALVEIVGEDAFALETEVEKLAAWAAGEAIGRREVEALAVHTHDTKAWTLGDAWGQGDLKSVLEAAEAQLANGEEPFLLAVRLAGHIGRVREVKALAEGGASLREIAARLKVHEFRARKAMEAGARYSSEELGAAVLRLAGLDFALKGGSRLSGELELERALVDVTSHRRGGARPDRAG